MTVVTEPVKIYTNVPRPIFAPAFAPKTTSPVEAPAEVEERELVPVRRKSTDGGSGRV